MKIKDRINSLREKLNQHNINYYVFDNPTITDFEYDILLKELENLENKNPQFINENSPTKRVGANPIKEFGTIKHSMPMLSLANAMDEIELDDFNKQIIKIVNKVPNIIFSIEFFELFLKVVSIILNIC